MDRSVSPSFRGGLASLETDTPSDANAKTTTTAVIAILLTTTGANCDWATDFAPKKIGNFGRLVSHQNLSDIAL